MRAAIRRPSRGGPTRIGKDDPMTDRLATMPKVELHLHLEGSMSTDTVRSLVDRHGADDEAIWPGGVPEVFSFADFPDFVRQYLFGLSLLRSADDLADTTENLAIELALQHVHYAEVTSTAFTHFQGGMSSEEYREGLDDGRRRASARGVEIGWVFDIPRDLEPAEMTTTIDFVAATAPDGTVALGLSGLEIGFPPTPYAPHFARAKALGLGAVPHAGETDGPDAVRSAMYDLGADRIGHGISSLDDPELIRRIVDQGLFLEVCPSSNALLGIVPSLADHPLPELIAAGVRLCINTDDPGWFATDLTTELGHGTSLFGIDERAHVRMQRDALDASFAPDHVRAAIARDLDDFETAGFTR
jgi:aminodeoxyfutalosine deaminase